MTENEAAIFGEVCALKAVVTALILAHSGDRKALGMFMEQSLEDRMPHLLTLALPDVAIDRYQTTGQRLRALVGS